MRQLVNLNIFYQGTAFIKGTIQFGEQKITSVTKNTTLNDCPKLLIPGLVDLQIYGAGGKLFSAEPSIENLIYIEDVLLKQGCTSFLICVATNTPEVFHTCIELVKKHHPIARNCMGIHLEGPYLNQSKSGAHVKEFIRKANLDEIKQLIEFGEGCIKMITLAPELQDDEVIDYLLDQKIIVSLGHSNATFEQATLAYNRGVQTTTHLFNAMSSLHHRQPGIPTAVFNHPTARASIIADGQHVDFEVIKVAQRIMKERLFLITDAVTDCSIGPYQHQAIDGKYILPDGTLSGSSLTLLQAIRNCIDFCGISLADGINMASWYPTQLLVKSDDIGLIQENAVANFLILDTDLNLEQVYFRGEEILNRTNQKN